MDPLGILDADLADVKPPELELSQYGFTERDLDKQIALGPGILPHFATEDRKSMSLREIIKLCQRIYCEPYLCTLERRSEQPTGILLLNLDIAAMYFKLFKVHNKWICEKRIGFRVFNLSVLSISEK